MLGCLAILVACVFALVLFGLGRAPSGREAALVASAAAAVLSAVLWVPLREVRPAVTRLVHGQRGPPEQALRAFGTRLSRALPLDELLLSSPRRLRRTLALSAAEVWIATDALLERAASDPARHARDARPDRWRAARARPRRRPGAAWAAVWLPVLVAGRGQAELRVAPIVNAGELLGLIVAQRRRRRSRSTTSDDRVLAELARQVGLTLRNLRLDSALQASLDELRRQADELRARALGS